MSGILQATLQPLPHIDGAVCYEAMPNKTVTQEDLANATRPIEGLKESAKEIKDTLRDLEGRFRSLETDIQGTNRLLKFIGAAGGILVVLVAGLASWYAISYVPSQMENKLLAHTGEINGKFAQVNEHLAKLDGHLDVLLKAVLTNTTSGTTDEVKAKLVIAKNVLSQARQQRIPLNKALIDEGERELRDHAPRSPELRPLIAETTQEFHDYQSFLNSLITEHSPATTPIEKPVLLLPGDLSLPKSKCPLPPPGYLTVYYSAVVESINKFPHTLIAIGGEDRLSINKNADGLEISAKIYESDSSNSARILNNALVADPNNKFRLARPNTHELVVYEQKDSKVVLDVHYLNPSAVKIVGVLNTPYRDPFILGEDGAISGSSRIARNCAVNVGGVSVTVP